MTGEREPVRTWTPPPCYDPQHKRAIELLALVVAEWQSDPLSVQCFDLRQVEEATALVAALRHAGEL